METADTTIGITVSNKVIINVTYKCNNSTILSQKRIHAIIHNIAT